MTRYRETGGERLQIDDENKAAVSIYGKNSAAGDTPKAVTNEGRSELGIGLGTSGAHGLLGIFTRPYDEADTARSGLAVLPVAWNGDTFDMSVNNEELIILASAARTATLQSADQVNYNGSGLIVIVDFETEVDTVSITPYLQIKDSISGNYFTIWTAAAAIEAVGTFAYLFAPGGAAGSFTEAVNLRLARTWRFGMTHADADSATYSVSAVILVQLNKTCPT